MLKIWITIILLTLLWIGERSRHLEIRPKPHPVLEEQFSIDECVQNSSSYNCLFTGNNTNRVRK